MPKTPRLYQQRNTVPNCNILAIMMTLVETWFWVGMFKNTVSLLTAMVGVLEMVSLPAGKAFLETTRSDLTIGSVIVTELLVSMCAEALQKANVHSLTDGRARVKGMRATELMGSCSAAAGKDDVTAPAVEKPQETSGLFRRCWPNFGMPAQND